MVWWLAAGAFVGIALGVAYSLGYLQLLPAHLAGDSAESTVAAAVDPLAPVLILVEPWVSQAETAALTTVKGQVKSTHPCTVKINGVAVELDAAAQFQRQLPLAEFAGVVRFEAIDNAGRPAVPLTIQVPRKLQERPWPDAVPRSKLWLWFDGRAYPAVVEDQRNGAHFVLIWKGQARLGSPAGIGKDDEHPQPLFEVPQPFYLGQTEVTVGQWRQFANHTGHVTWPEKQANQESTWKRPFPRTDFELREDHPATCLSWDDALAYTVAYGYRLPNELEWEYACRAGSDTTYWWSDAIEEGEGKGNVWDADGNAAVKREVDEAENPAHFRDGYPRLAPVGAFLAGRQFELHDMAGNVREWCQDAYDPDAYGKSPPNLVGLADSLRLTRGGSWYSSLDACRSAARHPLQRDTYLPDVGFRVARNIEK